MSVSIACFFGFVTHTLRLGFFMPFLCSNFLSLPADKAVSDQRAPCYRSVSAATCSLPLTNHLTKQICCCSRVGKAWGAGCDRCPLPGSGTAPKAALCSSSADPKNDLVFYFCIDCTPLLELNAFAEIKCCMQAYARASNGNERIGGKNIYRSVTILFFARRVMQFKIANCVWSGKGPKT